jgi:hypothetical protein
MLLGVYDGAGNTCGKKIVTKYFRRKNVPAGYDILKRWKNLNNDNF